jgi:hypothetical protein
MPVEATFDRSSRRSTLLIVKTPTGAKTTVVLPENVRLSTVGREVDVKTEISEWFMRSIDDDDD